MSKKVVSLIFFLFSTFWIRGIKKENMFDAQVAVFMTLWGVICAGATLVASIFVMHRYARHDSVFF